MKLLVRGNDHRLFFPYPGLPASIVATAWGTQLSVDTGKEPRLARFANVDTSGPAAPGPGAARHGVGTTAG